MNPVLVKIADVITRWVSAAATGQLTITIDFNQGGIRAIDVTEKTRLNLKN